MRVVGDQLTCCQAVLAHGQNCMGPKRTASKLGPARVEQRRRRDRQLGGDAPNALAGLIGSLEEKFSK